MDSRGRGRGRGACIIDGRRPRTSRSLGLGYSSFNFNPSPILAGLRSSSSLHCRRREHVRGCPNLMSAVLTRHATARHATRTVVLVAGVGAAVRVAFTHHARMACEEHTRPPKATPAGITRFISFFFFTCCSAAHGQIAYAFGMLPGGSFSEYRGRVARKLLHNVFLFQLLLTRSDAREYDIFHALPRMGPRPTSRGGRCPRAEGIYEFSSARSYIFFNLFFLVCLVLQLQPVYRSSHRYREARYRLL